MYRGHENLYANSSRWILRVHLNAVMVILTLSLILLLSGGKNDTVYSYNQVNI